MKTPREARVFTTTRAMSTSPYDRFRERNILRELEWLQRYGDVPNLFDEHSQNEIRLREEARNQAIATERAYLHTAAGRKNFGSLKLRIRSKPVFSNRQLYALVNRRGRS